MLKNNYQLDFIYNYNDLNMESLGNNTPLTSLPNHYVIEQNNKTRLGEDSVAFPEHLCQDISF